MQIKTRRTLRLVTMGLALVTSVGAGFLWAQHTNTINTVAAALLTAFCLLMAYRVESLAANAERALDALSSILSQDGADVVISDEKARQLERVISMLSDQNQIFRGNLLSDRVHEMDALRRQKLQSKSRH